VDSALLHLAGALNKRAVALFSNTDGRVMSEDYEKVSYINASCPLKVGPCWWEVPCVVGKTYQEKEGISFSACLSALDSKIVTAKVVEALHSKSRILIVMLTYNLLEMTMKAIDSIQSSHNYDVLVVDNESTDGTQKWLTKKGIEFVSKRMGVAAACNVGWKHFLQGNYDYVVLLNNDIVLRKDTIDKLVECQKQTQAFGVTASAIPNCPPWGVNWADLPNDGHEVVVDIEPGAYSATLFSKECLNKVGLFDEQFAPRYIEDNDYTLRIRLAGGIFVRSFSAGYFHALGAVLNSNEEERKYKDKHWIANIRKYIDKWGIHPHEPQLLSKIDKKFVDSCLGVEKLKKLAKDKPKFSVLVSRNMGGVGDHIMMSVVLNAIKTHFSEAKVIVAVPDQYKSLYMNYSFVDKIVNNFEYPADIRFDLTDTEFGIEHMEMEKYGRIVSSRARIFLDYLGFYLDFPKPNYVPLEEELKWAEREWQRLGLQKNRVAIVGDSSNLLKEWPHMNQLVELLQQNPDIVVLRVDAKTMGNFVYSLRQGAALLAKALLVVSGDTGYLHLAGALGKPVIDIQGYRSGEVYRQMYPSIKVVQGECPLRSEKPWCDYDVICYEGKNHRAKENLGHAPCLKNIAASKVAKLVFEELYGNSR
jgi:GT2 family glycosyltransferase/ADP-heptose:LPS heptosyltransferase